MVVQTVQGIVISVVADVLAYYLIQCLDRCIRKWLNRNKGSQPQRSSLPITGRNALESRILWGVSFSIVIAQTFIVYLDDTTYRNPLQEKFVPYVR